MLDFIGSAKFSLRVAMYVLTHRRLAAVIKKKAKHTDVSVIVDHTHMYCTGSQILSLLAKYDGGEKSCVKVYVDLHSSYMHHHKYLVVDDRLAMNGSVNFSEHAMVSGGFMTI